jgi:hypothetical protein
MDLLGKQPIDDVIKKYKNCKKKKVIKEKENFELATLKIDKKEIIRPTQRSVLWLYLNA